ncbi:MAG TPA: hypothetical protein VM869_21385 [Enhygromyxa sp.]|nr:hypothetical protein [Enhygromyxa sp.]
MGASMVLSSLWLGASLQCDEAPAPRWTAADLPGLPAASDNGWHAVTSEALDVSIPQPLAELMASRELDSEQFWSQLEPALLREFLASDGAREAIARIDDARREVAFADACPITAQICHVLDWHKAHDVALLQALAHAHEGRTTEALVLVRALVRMSAGQIESVRSPISLLVALDQLGDALHVAAMIVARNDPGTASAELAELIAEISALDVDTLDLRPLVLIHYLHYREALEAHRDDWFYSHALTLRLLDESFERRYQAASEGDVLVALGGEERSPTDAFGWWLRNPAGKRTLAAMAFDPSSLVRSIERSRADIRAERARLLANP